MTDKEVNDLLLQQRADLQAMHTAVEQSLVAEQALQLATLRASIDVLTKGRSDDVTAHAAAIKAKDEDLAAQALAHEADLKAKDEAHAAALKKATGDLQDKIDELQETINGQAALIDVLGGTELGQQMHKERRIAELETDIAQKQRELRTLKPAEAVDAVAEVKA